MGLNTTEQVLLIILSSFLAIFLILSVVVLVKLLQIFNHIKKIIEKAEKIADKAEVVSSFFERTASPIAVTKLISNIADHFFKKHKGKKNEE